MELPQKLNLHKRLKLEHSHMTLKRVREWEKLERLCARFHNHLHFTIHCKHRNITPVSLHIKSSMKGEMAKKIILRTQKSLMNVRIGEINFKIRTLKALIADINEELFIQLPRDTYMEVVNWVRHVHKEEWTKCWTRQQQKFEKLTNRSSNITTDPKYTPIMKVNQAGTSNIKDRWVINK